MAMAEAAGGTTGGAAPATGRGGEDSPSSFSPKNRLKFLCSYGGSILPRPNDVHFKYVGGDTRVLVVSRSISFNELKKMIQDMFRAEVVIKYQLAAADLDVLITVAGDNDLAYMFEEYDRLDALHPNSPSYSSSPRFRLFIFPSANAPPHPYAASSTLDQPSYIADAGSSKRSIFTISSSGRTSPTSSVDGIGPVFGQRKPSPGAGGGGGMQRVRSTPNLGDRGSGSGGSLVSLAQPGHGPKGGGGMNQHQLHHPHPHQQSHVHWQHGSGGVTGRQHGIPPGGVPWRMPGPAVRYDVCGCQMALHPTAPRGGYHYAPPYAAGHVGYPFYGHVEESSQNTAKAGLPRSPRSGGAPSSPSAGAAMRRPSVWDELQQ